MHAAVCDHFCAGADCRGHDQVTVPRIHPLTRADGGVVHQGRHAEHFRLRLGRRSRPRGFALRRSKVSQLRLHAKLCEHWQVEWSGDRFDRRSAVRKPNGTHSGAAYGIDDRSYLACIWLALERTEVETHCRAIEELGCRGEPSGKLILNRLCVRRADAKLCQTDLTEANLERGFARSLGFAHRFDLTLRKEREPSIAACSLDNAKCSGTERDLQSSLRIIFRVRAHGADEPMRVVRCALVS